MPSAPPKAGAFTAPNGVELLEVAEEDGVRFPKTGADVVTAVAAVGAVLAMEPVPIGPDPELPNSGAALEEDGVTAVAEEVLLLAVVAAAAVAVLKANNAESELAVVAAGTEDEEGDDVVGVELEVKVEPTALPFPSKMGAVVVTVDDDENGCVGWVAFAVLVGARIVAGAAAPLLKSGAEEAEGFDAEEEAGAPNPNTGVETALSPLPVAGIAEDVG